MMITFLKNKNHVPHTLFFRLLKLHLKKSELPSRNLILEEEKAYSLSQPQGKLTSQKEIYSLTGLLTNKQKTRRWAGPRPGLGHPDSRAYGH